MKILVTNDDGIFADGLWALVKELREIAQIAVVAPDKEQTAMGTAVSLRQPVRAKKVMPMVPEVETYAVEGTPADSVILALNRLVEDRIDLVISGINRGANLGDDVLISGTVGAALQGCLHGLPAFAISVVLGDNLYLDDAAKFAALLARKIYSGALPSNICLNVNLPNLPLERIKGVKITYPASKDHTDSVEERYEGRRQYYWFIRQRINKPTDERTDTWAIEQGNISITPLLTSLLNKPSPPIPDSFCADLFHELQQGIV
ncbi:MAG: 5'/3'-nucleotidase SurE [Dehalococcoidia bacterium]|nr:5'/3'-nucleotidase SurE [Dehalococcoidia bacterium]